MKAGGGNGGRLKARLGTALVVLVSLVAGLVAAEFLLRAFYPQRLYFNISQWDPCTGFGLIPGVEGVGIHQDYTMHTRINSRGMRDREFPVAKPAETLRVGVFGDSFTFGEGVQQDEAFPKVLERLLGGLPEVRQSGRTVEVLNFGVGKTATSHQLAWYRKEGYRYDLDLVVLAFLAANDFGGNSEGVYKLVDGAIIHNPAAYSSIRRIQAIVNRIPLYPWLAGHSHLVNLVRVIATTADDRARIDRAVGEQGGGVRGSEERKAYAYDITLKLVEEFARDAHADGARFMMVNVPSKDHRPERTDAGAPLPEWIVADERLLADLGERGIRTVDLAPVFASLPVEGYFFEHDGHMTAQGNARIAGEITRPVWMAL